MRILAHARSSVSENGFEGTTTQDIARRSNVSEGSVFAHFGSKQGLLLAIMQEHYSAITERAQNLSASQSDPEVRLKALIAFHLKNMRVSWQELRAFAHYGRYANTEMSHFFRDLNRRYSRIFLDCLEELISEDRLSQDWSLDMLRDLIFGTAEHWAFRAMELDQNLDHEQAVSFIMSRLPFTRFTKNSS